MKKSKAISKEEKDEASPSHLIDARIAELGDWRGEAPARIRGADPGGRPGGDRELEGGRGVPVWERDGILCTGETYKAVVKLTFAKGAALDGSVGPLQRQPRRQHPGGRSTSARARRRRRGAEGAGPRRRGAQHVGAS